MIRNGTRLVLIALAALLAACVTEDDGGTGSTDIGSRDRGRDIGFDATGPGDDAGGGQDTAPQPDATPQPDTAPACGGFDQACCGGGVCDLGLSCQGGLCAVPSDSDCPAVSACIEPVPGTPDVPIATQTGNPPTLAGGTIQDGAYELDRIDVYTDSAFSSLVSVSIDSNGDSYGSLEFEGADWGFDANLDLYIAISAIGQNFDQLFAQRITAGGCFTVNGNDLIGDLTQCGDEWPEGSEPPDSLDFETTATGIRLLLILPKETILAAVPEENRSLAEFAIVGDLPILFTF